MLLYHYTSLEALIQITDSRVLWASECHFLNDGRELKHALDIAKRSIAEVAKTVQFDDALVLEQANAALDAVGNICVFVASFSENGDLLSQWRAYCPSSQGISIGIDIEDLRVTCAAQDFRLVRCSYDPESHASDIATLTEELFRKIHLIGDDPTWIEHFDLIQDFADRVVEAAPTMKDAAFSEEREWRIVCNDFEGMRYRAGKSFIIPFVPFCLPGADNYLKLGELVVGPTPDLKLSKQAIQWLLNERAAGFTVRESSVPYRSW